MPTTISVAAKPVTRPSRTFPLDNAPSSSASAAGSGSRPPAVSDGSRPRLLAGGHGLGRIHGCGRSQARRAHAHAGGGERGRDRDRDPARGHPPRECRRPARRLRPWRARQDRAAPTASIGRVRSSGCRLRPRGRLRYAAPQPSRAEHADQHDAAGVRQRDENSEVTASIGLPRVPTM